MKRFVWLGLAALLIAAAALVGWRLLSDGGEAAELTLYGNVDLREVDLAFNNSQRIAAEFVHEGDRVRKGEVLAQLDTNRLKPQVAAAAATVEVDKVNVENTRLQYNRASRLWSVSHGDAISREALDNAKANFDSAVAHQDADTAQLALLKEQLADAVLIAPTEATVRTRILEPGDMATPQTPVFSLAITDPKWVRVYAGEEDLPKLHPGMKAVITVDGFPNRRFQGWIGFISPVAEFTPKTVETPELRTSLVYEVRAFVKDPGDSLRLGMPATVHIALPPPPHA
jgi:HlyD family secretion protein